MFIRQVFPSTTSTNDQLILLREECSDFLTEMQGQRMYKALPRTYPDVKRVKVRHRNTSVTTPIFNRLFEHVSSQMWERAVDASATIPDATDTLEPFAIFVPNGFKYIQASPKAIQEALTVALSVNTSMDTICEAILTNAITHADGLTESLSRGANNFIFYAIPAFYAVRLSQLQEL